MNQLTSGFTGSFHLIVSILAMITGIMVLGMQKGTRRHRQLGYLYAVAMLLVNLTAFMIYRLFGGFGIFHFFAIVSLLTLGAGMYPIIGRKEKNDIFRHFNFMYWSVVGLYCAFCAEVLTRIPTLLAIPNSWRLFSILTGVSIFIVMLIATAVFKKYKPRWKKQFNS
jgi:uncharacterized membrane protein